MRTMRGPLLFVVMSVICWARTPLERLEIARLEAVHAQRVEWMQKRIAAPLLGVYQDYRAILHIHAEDADHTKGTRAEVLKAARETDVKVIMFTDHRGPKPETWRGLRDGVLFIPGAENDHELTYPASGGSPTLRFLSHLEERPDMPSDGFQGQEIYNRHTDAVFHKEFHQWMGGAMKDEKEWKKLVAKQKQFPDEVYAAATDALPLFLARFDKETAKRPFTGIAANDAHQNQIFNGTTFDPYAVAFRFVSTHILARELTELEIRASLAAGHVYVSHDWLCDPTGFSFVAQNNLGVFDMGDQIPLMNNTRLEARFPIEAKIKLIRAGEVMAEVTDSKLTYTIREPGPYRLEAWLTVDGEDRPWIFSNPIYAGPPPDRNLPAAVVSQKVDVRRDITYTDGDAPAGDKHKLDLYLPKGQRNFPMLVFIHGGSWRSGDRNLYTVLGNRFAESGIGVAIPSYRLMPKNPHPAQIEDAAAAVAWVYKNLAEYGGDTKRLYIAGHSAGGHLVALLALDDSYLKKHDMPISAIKGVAALSGVYDVSRLAQFQVASARDASPLHYLGRKEAVKAPPFVITYCQWDYPTLPFQARELEAALKKAFVPAKLVYVPGENHISEMVNIGKDDDVTARAILDLVK
jgi:acetyl esterase/lipase